LHNHFSFGEIVLNIEDLLGLDLKAVAEMVKYLFLLIAAIAFLVFFAVSPMHALILCGFLVMFGSMYLKVEREVRKMAFIIGCLLSFVGFMGILVPSIGLQILSVAEDIRRQLSILRI